MNGYDVQQWILLVEKVTSHGIQLSPKGEQIVLLESGGLIMGTFDTVSDAFYFMCGYEQGLSKGIPIVAKPFVGKVKLKMVPKLKEEGVDGQN